MDTLKNIQLRLPLFIVASLAAAVLAVNDLLSRDALKVGVHSAESLAFIALAFDGHKKGRPLWFRIGSYLTVAVFAGLVIIDLWIK